MMENRETRIYVCDLLMAGACDEALSVVRLLARDTGNEKGAALIITSATLRPHVLALHRWLGWAAWRGMLGTLLSGADLSVADLRGANLSDANLRGANLSYANLSDANLSGATMPDGGRHA